MQRKRGGLVPIREVQAIPWYAETGTTSPDSTRCPCLVWGTWENKTCSAGNHCTTSTTLLTRSVTISEAGTIRITKTLSTSGTLQAKGGLFPWHDESLRELFEQVSEAGVDRVQEELERWQAH